MLTLRHHNSQDYARLPDIDDTDAGIISITDQACLDEIGDCLLRAKAHSRFAATLLHSHFPIQDDETLFEEAQVDQQLLTLQPVRRRPSSIFPINVCFDNADTRCGELRLVGLEFTSRQTLGDVAPIDDSDLNVLTSLSAIIHRHGKASRFGIRLLHDPLKLHGAMLLETCDPVHRILTCRSGKADDLASIESIPTVFRWEDLQVRGEDDLVIAQECIQFCKTVQRCVKPVHGSHKQSSSHELAGHRSV